MLQLIPVQLVDLCLISKVLIWVYLVFFVSGLTCVHLICFLLFLFTYFHFFLLLKQPS